MNHRHRIAVVWLLGLLLAAACGSTSGTRGGGKISLLPVEPASGFVLDRARYEAIVTGSPNWLIQRVEVEPIKEGAAFVGFLLISGVEAEADLATTGLRHGDIIQQVNGMPIGRPEEFMRVWGGLAGRDALQIQILRAGQPFEVTWLIR